MFVTLEPVLCGGNQLAVAPVIARRSEDMYLTVVQ
jgi:hypothetical protein